METTTTLALSALVRLPACLSVRSRLPSRGRRCRLVCLLSSSCPLPSPSPPRVPPVQPSRSDVSDAAILSPPLDFSSNERHVKSMGHRLRAYARCHARIIRHFLSPFLLRIEANVSQFLFSRARYESLILFRKIFDVICINNTLE